MLLFTPVEGEESPELWIQDWAEHTCHVSRSRLISMISPTLWQPLLHIQHAWRKATLLSERMDGWMDGWMDECHHILKVRFFTFVYIFIMEKILLIMTNFHIIHFSSRKIELSLHALGLTLFLDWKAAAIAPRIFSFRERARLCCLLWCANRTINYSPTLNQVTPAVPGARSLRSHIHLVEIKTSPTKGKEDIDPQEHY